MHIPAGSAKLVKIEKTNRGGLEGRGVCRSNATRRTRARLRISTSGKCLQFDEEDKKLHKREKEEVY